MTAGKRSRRELVHARGLLAEDLVGTTYGSLTVVSRKTSGSSWNLKVEVRCRDCGEVSMDRFHNMRKRLERVGCTLCRSRSPVVVPLWLYRRCQSQQARCRTPSGPNYKHYGARGIEFRFAGPNEAACWIAEHLGVPDDTSLQIDRIDNDGHYEPGNLRWATRAMNMNNTRRNRGARERFLRFRRLFPEVRYADKTLARMINLGKTDAEIIARWRAPSHKPKGKYGTCTPLGPYRGPLPTDS